MRTAVVVLAAAALVGCNRGNSSDIASGGLTPWSEIPSTEILAPEGVSYSMVTANGAEVAQISGVPDNASTANRTGGVSVRLPAPFEAEASGQRVQIVVRASSPQEGALLGVAYSTAEVGNSGWQRFVLSPQPRDYVFAYGVRQMREANGDYLAFRSYGDGVVQIHGYKVEVVPRPGAAAAEAASEEERPAPAPARTPAAAPTPAPTPPASETPDTEG